MMPYILLLLLGIALTFALSPVREWFMRHYSEIMEFDRTGKWPAR